MSAGRNWRMNGPFATFGSFLWRCAVILTWPFRHPHEAVKAAEPWGILFAVLAFSYEIYQRGEDRADRQRDLIDRSWTRIHAAYPENGTSAGLSDAIETLVSFDKFLTEVKLPRANLSGAKLWGAYLESANLEGAILSEANLGGANLSLANLGGANLSPANLSGAYLLRADLREANLYRAKLEGANLGWANLSDANLEGANLAGANLAGANLSGAYLRVALRLTQEQLDEACGNENTGLPGDLTIPMCSEVDWFETFHDDR